MTILVIVAAVACVGAVIASAIMSRASNHSALWSMMVGALLGLLTLLAAIVIAYFMARAAWGPPR